jgi:uncharacterized membrane protein
MKVFTDHRFILAVYVAITIAVSAHKYSLGDKFLGGRPQTRYNNFNIFKQSSAHLLHHQDLYELYPEEHWDYFKYSPTFAFLAIPLHYIPDLLGLILWNLANALALFFALRCLPISPMAIVAVQWLVLKDLLTSIQNAQSNALVAASVVMVFAMIERKKVGTAAFCLALSFFVKLYGVVVAIVMLLFPQKRKFVGYSALWFAVLALVPLLVISPRELVGQYESWNNLLGSDHTINYGMSVMGWLHSWFGLEGHKTVTVLIGGFLLLLPLVHIKSYENPLFRLWFLSAVLIWMVIFNHMAESPTFVIAICGVAIWYATCQRTRLDTGLVIFAFVFTSLSASDVFPRPLRNLIVPYQLKAIPCIVVWAKIMFDLVLDRVPDMACNVRRLPAPTPAISRAA